MKLAHTKAHFQSLPRNATRLSREERRDPPGSAFQACQVSSTQRFDACHRHKQALISSARVARASKSVLWGAEQDGFAGAGDPCARDQSLLMTVTRIESLGGTYLAGLERAAWRITALFPGQPRCVPGQTLEVSFRMSQLHFFDRRSGLSLRAERQLSG